MIEAIATGAGGGLVAALAVELLGLIVDVDWLLLPAVGVATVNGLICGWVGIYSIPDGKGLRAFFLDSTWGFVGTAIGLLLHGAQLFWKNSDYVVELSERRNRHVYNGGVSLKGGYAFTQGNVISNAGGKVGLRGESDRITRRQKFVTKHEELHVWQNRWFGPLFQVLYGGWFLVGALVGAMLWLAVRGGLGTSVETMAYYNNPFEYWAYRNDKYWPPRGVHPRLAWKGPDPESPTIV